MTENNRNIIIAIVLSMLVLVGWQFLVAGPQMERSRQAAIIAAEQQAGANTGLSTPIVATDGSIPADAAPTVFETRDAAIAATARVTVDTAELMGSINLTGARLDDLHLKNYRETVEDDSPIITLLSPVTTAGGYYIEQGWVTENGETAVPTDAVWTIEGVNQMLREGNPVTLAWDNGAGLIFRRTFEVDEHYLFTVTQAVENTGTAAVTLMPFSRVVRVGTPHVANFFIMHEGPLGVLGANNLVGRKYADLAKEQRIDLTSNGGWLGFTDKYWATAVLPEPQTPISTRMSWRKPAGLDIYETSYVGTQTVVVAPGTTANNKSYVFAGAKVEAVIANYGQVYGFDRLDLLIDWGWFHFLTWPLFLLLRALYGILGNFGLAILTVTILVKAVFFPLASRSYASMAAMRRVQPEMKAIQERHKEDRPAQQTAMMELYKKEKINPLSGCWPLLIQIPVFFSLYTIIFISLEMRHAPFFGWIQDLAAPDPTNIFTLFGLIPWTPTALPLIGNFLHLGVWPVIMGITMWVQMKLNPPPTDATQAMIFAWMPVIFTFMLGTFPAGLVIYWAWNNTLSVTQQWFIMRRHGVEVNLLGNILSTFKRKPKPAVADKA
ncbi:MAG: insertase [Devosia sp.]|nr:insertase [Devosia sp.]